MAFKCSLLTLSCALDGELPTETQAELESHLVGCERCKIGLQYLREETERIANLPRIHLPGGTIDALLQRTRVVEVAPPAAPVPAAAPSAPDEVRAPARAATAAPAVATPPAAAADDDPSSISIEVRGRPADAPPTLPSIAAVAGPGAQARRAPADGAGTTPPTPPRVAATPPPPPSAERRAAPRERGDRAAEPGLRPRAEPRSAAASAADAEPAAAGAGVAGLQGPGADPRRDDDRPAGPPRRRPSARAGDGDAIGRRPPRGRAPLWDAAWPRVAASAAVVVAVVLLGLHLAGSGGPARPPRPAATPATHRRAGGTGARHHRAAATPTAGARPTAAPTPRPTPATVGVPALTGATTLGGAAAGYTVQTARYGLHSDGFWVVFQLVGSSGAPRATVGFAGPTTLDVELRGVRPGTPVPAPLPGMVVTSVAAGGSGTTAVYTLHLTRAVQVSPSYLPGSLTGLAGERLILILH